MLSLDFLENIPAFPMSTYVTTPGRHGLPFTAPSIFYLMANFFIHRLTSSAAGLVFRSRSLSSENDSYRTPRAYDTEGHDDGSQRECVMLGKGYFRPYTARVRPTRPLRRIAVELAIDDENHHPISCGRDCPQLSEGLIISTVTGRSKRENQLLQRFEERL